MTFEERLAELRPKLTYFLLVLPMRWEDDGGPCWDVELEPVTEGELEP